jgi:hypothetical protein
MRPGGGSGCDARPATAPRHVCPGRQPARAAAHIVHHARLALALDEVGVVGEQEVPERAVDAGAAAVGAGGGAVQEERDVHRGHCGGGADGGRRRG